MLGVEIVVCEEEERSLDSAVTKTTISNMEDIIEIESTFKHVEAQSNFVVNTTQGPAPHPGPRRHI